MKSDLAMETTMERITWNLMGRVKFREVLRLQDGDTVNIEVDGDDDWWESGH